MSKYDPIGKYLSCIEPTQEKITLSFHKIEEILGCKLPNSAYQYQAWWSYEQKPKTHVQKHVWQEAGWCVDGAPDFSRKQVTFKRLNSFPAKKWV
ncbi:MAG: hypothetical protein CL609_23140 [Anaerolineaceae bacterium]|nr:hypothetical protein [Anaerolineaceae bacterium]